MMILTTANTIIDLSRAGVRWWLDGDPVIELRLGVPTPDHVTLKTKDGAYIVPRTEFQEALYAEIAEPLS